MAVYKSKAVTKDGRKWYFSIRYLTANGEQKRKKSQYYKSKPEAQEAEHQFLIEIKQNKIDITFEELYNQYLSYAEESIKGSSKFCKDSRIRNHILPHFGKMNIHNITINTIISWKTKINEATYGKKDKKKYSLNYKQTLMIELRTVLRYAVNFCGLKDILTGQIMMFHNKGEAVITDEEKIRYITPIEYNLFASVIDNIVFKVFFAFLYYMGVRKGEAQALVWDDIDFEKCTARIIKTITNKTYEVNENGFRFKITNTKNRKNRTIKIPIILNNMLLELYQYYIDFEGFTDNWFVFGGYRHLPCQSINNVRGHCFKQIKERYGKEINQITNHEFRHSHASYLISRGVKAELIAYRLGDTVDVVLKTYAHMFPEVEDSIIEELDLIEDNYKINEATKKEFLKSQQATKIL